MIFSSPGRSPGRAIILTPALALAAALALAKCLSFYVKVFDVMGKALSGELSCVHVTGLVLSVRGYGKL